MVYEVYPFGNTLELWLIKLADTTIIFKDIKIAPIQWNGVASWKHTANQDCNNTSFNEQHVLGLLFGQRTSEVKL